MSCIFVSLCIVERITEHTSLHPVVDEKMRAIAKENGRTVSGQISEFVTEGVKEGRYVLKDLNPELEAEMIASAKKENRNVENFIETALKVYLKRIEYVPIYH